MAFLVPFHLASKAKDAELWVKEGLNRNERSMKGPSYWQLLAYFSWKNEFCWDPFFQNCFLPPAPKKYQINSQRNPCQFYCTWFYKYGMRDHTLVATCLPSQNPYKSNAMKIKATENKHHSSWTPVRWKKTLIAAWKFDLHKCTIHPPVQLHLPKNCLSSCPYFTFDVSRLHIWLYLCFLRFQAVSTAALDQRKSSPLHRFASWVLQQPLNNGRGALHRFWEHLSTWIPLGQWCLLGQSSIIWKPQSGFLQPPKAQPITITKKNQRPGGDHFQLQYAHWKISKHMTILDDHRVLFISDASVGSQASLAFVAGADAQACLGWTQRLFQDGRNHHLRSPIFMAGIPMMSNTRLFFGFFADPRTWRTIKISSYKCCAMVQKSAHDWKLGHKVTTPSVLGFNSCNVFLGHMDFTKRQTCWT